MKRTTLLIASLLVLVGCTKGNMDDVNVFGVRLGSQKKIAVDGATKAELDFGKKELYEFQGKRLCDNGKWSFCYFYDNEINRVTAISISACFEKVDRADTDRILKWVITQFGSDGELSADEKKYVIENEAYRITYSENDDPCVNILFELKTKKLNRVEALKQK